MASLYDVCDLVFENDTGRIEHKYDVSIQDYGDSIELRTTIVFKEINRGWVGNIAFCFNGYDIEDGYGDRTAREQVVLKDVLCSRRTFEKDHKDVVWWTYTFLKY